MDAVRTLIAQNSLIASRLGAIENLIVNRGIDLGPVTDPSPDGGLGGIVTGGFGGILGGGIGPIADPSPIDLGKLSRVQLETRLADVELTRKKLDAVEGMFKEALDKL
ncbi:hypothetical protein [Litoreibacter roseus]|uniref:Uncharacterized protein n=1 Tax=Litoreibacter roseus TaxID=2601869 RepID=A0A6N6JN65_9RHOB|nr:hypothetical protein [Litoreibacter roseus]GFE66818.1 hypothetical protein KIN_38920 [Litoreibacter roseus]